MITSTEAMILNLLTSKPQGAYGSELMHLSGGKLKRGSVYSLLGRLEKAGFVKSTEHQPSDVYALPRTSYRITGEGLTAQREFAEYVGLQLPQHVLGVA